MPINLPNALSPKDWVSKVTADVEKTIKLSPSITALCAAHEAAPHKLLELDDVKSPEEALQRAKDIDDKIAKKIESALGKLGTDLGKAEGALKKAGKEAAGKTLAAALKTYEGSLDKAIAEAKSQLKTLAEKLEKERKAAAAKAKDDAEDPGDAKDAAAINKRILNHNQLVKRAVRELKSGKVKSYPFVFGQNKVYSQYKKGMKLEDWKNKSLAHVGKKAVKTFRGPLAKMMATESLELAFGEVSCPDGKKLIFNCESKMPKAKLLKEALVCQLGFAPPLQLRKGAEVEDEAGEGEDANEPLEDIADEDEGEEGGVTAKDVQARFAKMAAQIAAAMSAGGASGDEMKKLATAVKGLMGSDAKAGDADKLLDEIEKRLQRGKPVTAGAGGASPSPELEAALRELVGLRARAVEGVGRVAGLIRKAYEGDPQFKKATEGANRIDQAKSLLTPAVELQIGALLKEPDAAQRAQKARALRASVASYRQSIAGHELLPDIDKSDFDPALNVIAPYIAMLQRAENLIGGLAA